MKIGYNYCAVQQVNAVMRNMNRRWRGEESMLGRDAFEAILIKGSDSFSRHGFADTRMSELAFEAGVSKGRLYNLFQTKRKLFHQCFLYKIEIENDEAFRASKSPSAPWNLGACLRLHLRIFSERGSSIDLLRVSNALADSAFEKSFYERRLLPAIKQCKPLIRCKDGASDCIETTEAVATTLILSILGFCLWNKMTESGRAVRFFSGAVSFDDHA